MTGRLLRTRARHGPIPGRAQPEDTARLTRERLPRAHTRLPACGLTTARLALDLDGLDPRVPAHHRAAAEGLRRGVNLLDLGVASADPKPATLAGQVLRSADLPREALILAVHVHAPPDADLPRRVDRELAAGTAAAGVGGLDLAIVDVPAHASTAQIISAGRVAQAHCDRGALSGYVLAFSSVEPVPDPRALRVHLAPGDDPCHLVAIQVPWSGHDPAAVTGDPPLADRVHDAGLAIWAREAAHRTPDPAPRPDGPSSDDAISAAARAVRVLEGRWAAGLGASLRVGDGDAVDLFRWGQVIDAFWRQGPTAAAWEDLRARTLAPHLGRASAELLRALGGPARAEFQAWWVDYAAAMHTLFEAVEDALARQDRPARAPTGAAISQLVPAAWRELAAPQVAVAAVLAAGVDLVVTRASTGAAVDEHLAALDPPAPELSCDDARRLLRATSAAT